MTAERAPRGGRGDPGGTRQDAEGETLVNLSKEVSERVDQVMSLASEQGRELWCGRYRTRRAPQPPPPVAGSGEGGARAV